MTVSVLAGDEASEDKNRTFVFNGEDHTLGNALSSIISKYPEVIFCGYTIPHPHDNKINFRIQTKGPRAIDVLRRGLNDLDQLCLHISETFKMSKAIYEVPSEVQD